MLSLTALATTKKKNPPIIMSSSINNAKCKHSCPLTKYTQWLPCVSPDKGVIYKIKDIMIRFIAGQFPVPV